MQLSIDMEKEERNQIASCKSLEPEFFLQWGNKKRLRCVRVRDPQIISRRSDGVFRRKITSRIDRFVVSSATTEKDTSLLQSNRITRLDFLRALNRPVLQVSGPQPNRELKSPNRENEVGRLLLVLCLVAEKVKDKIWISFSMTQVVFVS
ncbi:hypothetical protein NC651_039749 [Populus alba x Populus x berolinensis]|nr:hypothetical protein NC651_039749 [Populus alba x Populus x berolinensis]